MVSICQSEINLDYLLYTAVPERMRNSQAKRHRNPKSNRSLEANEIYRKQKSKC